MYLWFLKETANQMISHCRNYGIKHQVNFPQTSVTCNIFQNIFPSCFKYKFISIRSPHSIIAARILSLRESYVFSYVCLSVHRGSPMNTTHWLVTGHMGSSISTTNHKVIGQSQITLVPQPHGPVQICSLSKRRLTGLQLKDFLVLLQQFN